MDGRRDEAAVWLRRAAERYRESWEAGAPSDSWGRPIAAMKALLLAGDTADAAALWALAAGARDADSPIGRYAGVLALLVLGEDAEAGVDASTLRGRDDFPSAVADSLAAIAAGDREGFARAVEDVLESFEQRADYLEDARVADTVLAVQVLASRRGLEADLRESELLPHR